MTRMRHAKRELRTLLTRPDWQDALPAIARGGMAHVGPLIAFLPLEARMRHRAARALGLTVAAVARQDAEAGRNVMRRLMWHMNEESGNIGWGIPEAFAEILAASAPLAREFHRILISYIMDLGHDDNFCDHDVLRRSCYWAVGRLATCRPELCLAARPWLRKGLGDADLPCRGMAAWALGRLPPDLMDAPALRALAGADCEAVCEIAQDDTLRQATVSQLARKTLARVARARADSP